MRKFLILMLVVVLALGAGVSLVACSGDVDLPGLKWTNEEVLTYEMYDGDVLVGALAVKTERVDSGNQTLNMTGETHNVSASTVKGARVTMVASDLDGNEIMASESLLNGFTTLASAKKVSYNGVEYTTKARYDGKRYYYSVNGGEEKKMKIKQSFVDNELLYTVLRAYTLENSYSGTYIVVDNVAGEKVEMNISTSNADVCYNGANNAGIKVLSDGIESLASNVKCVELNIQRASAPVGTPIKVTYSVEGDGGLSVLGKGSAGHRSTHVPVKIVENNITYKLASIDCK